MLSLFNLQSEEDGVVNHTDNGMAAAPPATAPNMDWLLSEPLLDAALANIKTLDQFRALESSFVVLEEQGKVVPENIQGKLAVKRETLWKTLVKTESDNYLEESGLGPLVIAKRKWDDVHFMAEAHGVGSSIPMVTYTGLSQEEMEQGMNQFYNHLQLAALNLKDSELQEAVLKVICDSYQELHETATGEFGGYEPFPGMVDHTPAKVKEILVDKNSSNDGGNTGSSDSGVSESQ